jgi:hypothetical protein
VSEQQPDQVEAAPEPAARRRWSVPWEAAAASAGLSLLAVVALTGAGGSTLVAVAVIVAFVLAAVAAVRRSATVAVVAAVMAGTALTVAVGLSLGDRARASGDRGVPFPAVVGLPLDRAKALFDQHGPVHYVIKRVPYGARGTVLRATGYSTDGTFTPGSTITLVVGTRAPRP